MVQFTWTATSWSRMVWRNRSTNTARCLGCRVHSTLRPVHWQVQCTVLCPRARKVQPSQVPSGGIWGQSMVLLLVNGPPFVSRGPCLILGRNAATAVGVHPAWRCASFQDVLLAGLGAGVGDRRGGTAILNAVPLFTPLFF